MASGNSYRLQWAVSVLAVVTAIGGWAYSAGVIGERTDNNYAQLEKKVDKSEFRATYQRLDEKVDGVKENVEDVRDDVNNLNKKVDSYATEQRRSNQLILDQLQRMQPATPRRPPPP